MRTSLATRHLIRGDARRALDGVGVAVDMQHVPPHQHTDMKRIAKQLEMLIPASANGARVGYVCNVNRLARRIPLQACGARNGAA